MLLLNYGDLLGLQQTVMEGRFSDRQSWRLVSVVDITLLKFSSAEAAQTVYLLSPLTGSALLIYHDQLPTLIAIIHSPVHRKAHRAAGLQAWHKEPGKRGRRNACSYEMRGIFHLKTKAGEMLLFLRSVCQLACFSPSAPSVKGEARGKQVSGAGRRARKIEGRQGKHGTPELTQLKRREDGDGRPGMFLQEPFKPEKSLFFLRLNFSLVHSGGDVL